MPVNESIQLRYNFKCFIRTVLCSMPILCKKKSIVTKCLYIITLHYTTERCGIRGFTSIPYVCSLNSTHN